MQKKLKPEFYCEECGFQTDTLECVKKTFLFCKECAEAEKRRQRLKKADQEWDAFDKKNN